MCQLQEKIAAELQQCSSVVNKMEEILQDPKMVNHEAILMMAETIKKVAQDDILHAEMMLLSLQKGTIH